MLYNDPSYVKEFRKTEYPIEDFILKRWSPRAFGGENLKIEEIMPLFEAAKWAPSASNIQPWRFLYALKDTENWDTFFHLLNETNKLWVYRASVLVVIISQVSSTDGSNINKTAIFDTGAAWQNLALQGNSMGLVVHPVSGFDYDAARKELSLPDNFVINAMVAIGHQGDKNELPVAFQEREVPSDRNLLSDLIKEGIFSF